MKLLFKGLGGLYVEIELQTDTSVHDLGTFNELELEELIEYFEGVVEEAKDYLKWIKTNSKRIKNETTN